MIAENLKSVTRRIAECCKAAGRPAGDVKLVCVTKQAGVAEIEEALAAGVNCLGENRVQDAVKKHRLIGDKAQWHLVGHLQTNKARDAVRIFSLIHSVDSVRLAKAIDKEAARIGKVQDALLQVNVSGEDTKFGIAPDELYDVFKDIVLSQNINIIGLMTIAPETGDPETARPHFRRLRELKDSLNGMRGRGNELRTLSMGMTDDFEAAIEEGSTLVRIGRAIFEGTGYDR